MGLNLDPETSIGDLSVQPTQILGITGSIGGGKSTVAGLLAQRNAVIADADEFAGRALAQPAVLEELREAFGEEVRLPSGQLDRSRLAAIVFADRSQLRRLERIIHPRVRKQIERTIADHSGGGLIVLDVPLLFEAGLDQRCDQTWMIDAPRSVRLERVGNRGWDDLELRRREQNQWPIEKKREMADVVIDNGGTLAQLEKAVHAALQTWLQ